MTKSKQNVDDVLFEALKKYVTSDNGELLLHKTQGKPNEALLVGSGKLISAAKSKLAGKQNPLVKCETRSRKQFVQGLTDNGVAFLVDQIPNVDEIVANARDDFKSPILAGWAKKLNRRLGAVRDELSRAITAMQSQFASLSSKADQVSADLHRAEMQLARQAASTSSNSTNGLQLAPLEESPTDNGDFGRITALAKRWQSTTDLSSRADIEQELSQFGAKKYGEVGQIMEYDSYQHECTTPHFPGSPVKVLEPGWRIEDNGDQNILAKAKVRTVQ